MRFDEQPVCARGERAARQHRREFTLAARPVAAAAGKLHGMRGVKNHREPKPKQQRYRAHVGHEIVIAEGCAAFRYENSFGAGAFGFFDDLAHFQRRQELALFQVDDPSGRRRRRDQVRLPAQESGDLEDIHDFAGDGGLGFRVDIGQDRDA